MRRYCNGSDPNLVKVNDPCDCGAFFDDEDYSTVFPHREINGHRVFPETARVPLFRRAEDRSYLSYQPEKKQ